MSDHESRNTAADHLESFYRPFNEVYNIETVQPTTEWLDMYYAVKEDLRRMGLKLA